MTTLRKLPTIAPRAKAKALSRLKVESYAIAGTRANVTTRAFRNGGEWGLVASAVFKTVVSARKRRRVGSIPTRLRQIRQKAEGRKQKSWRRWDRSPPGLLLSAFCLLPLFR